MPKLHLKPVRDQVIVLTGATSGIGLATARMAAERGASLFLVARNEDALRSLRDELRARGGRTEYAVADVADAEAVEAAAQKAIEVFGGFDTWVNNAGGSMYGTVEDTPLADQRRAFDVLYWGVVNGTQAAAKHLKRRGGVIVNVGSVLSDRTIALQGTYSAAKHAVKGITDTFRMEYESAGYPIGVTLVKPSSIDTLFPEHSRNHTDTPGLSLPPPTYHPRVVGKAILHAAEHAPRTLVVGMGGYAISLLGNHFPRLTDLLMEATASKAQTRKDPGRKDRHDNLYEPRADLAETGSYKDKPMTRRTSYFLEAQMHPLGATGILFGVGALVLGVSLGLRHQRRSRAARLLEQAQSQSGSLGNRARRLGGRLLSDHEDDLRNLRNSVRKGGRQLVSQASDRAEQGQSLLASLFGSAQAEAKREHKRAWSLFGQARDEAQDRARGLRGGANSLLARLREEVEELTDRAQENSGRARKEAHSLFGRARHSVDDLAERLQEVRSQARGSAADWRDRAGSQAQELNDQAKGLFRRARHDTSDLRKQARGTLDTLRDEAADYADYARKRGGSLLGDLLRGLRRSA
ncbi:SDR family oxidoreductase [Roseomonas elaeocarpi]|uniref:SDR family oxidoreductase n=1 Tax=Roseomonas elaeocarpi TaxID=907779 RepID=A0ABV6JRY1_9PROT